jgi:hypothetical protein
MVRSFSVIALISLTALAAARAAGPFDGQWSGGSPAVHVGTRTCAPTTATVTVANGKMAGKYEVGISSSSIRGNVASDGSVTGHWGGNSFSGKFAGDHFSGTYNSGLCGTERPVSLDRAK